MKHLSEPLTRREFALGAASGTFALALSNKAAMGASYIGSGEDLASLTLAQVASRLQARSVSSVDVVQACLNRISAYDKKINSFITVCNEQALAEARALDAEAARGKFRSRLHGVPIALKDTIDTAGIRTTAASGIFADRVPTTDAEVVRKLKDAGAIIIGKLNLGELALDGTGAESNFGPCRNPWAIDRITGGSSSGSGAALAADFCYGTLGTDTGGSVRIPAAYCGVVGMRPTFGLVSVRGTMQVELSLDTCGPMARCVEDAALLLTTISGYDKLDIISVAHGAEDYTASIRQSVSDIRVGIPRKPYFDDVDPEIAGNVETALGVIGKLTRGMKDVTLPPDLSENIKVISVPEIHTYHHRLQRQGFAARYETFGKTDRKVHGLLLHPENCTQVAGGICNEDLEAYVQLRWDLDMLRRTDDDAFSDFDVVVVPTTKTMPIPIADVLRSGVANPTYTLLRNTLPFGFYGWPAISLPCGFSTDGLPIGLMIAGPHFSERKLFALAYAYEQATSWLLKRPIGYL